MQSNLDKTDFPKTRDARPLALPPCETSLEWLHHAHGEQMALCAELEEIADSLPNTINRQKCIYAAKALTPLIKGVHHYGESILFPWLETSTSSSVGMHETLNRLRFEHCEDECFAEELTDALLKLGSGSEVNMEAVGYMLRGFFEGLRRHIAFEREHILCQIGETQLS
ncbi:hemerythrin domain-containing protein [Agrobacterium vitis]|uniref:hemerythrin domain-containing protein n=1 Tax=Agrobacterium vitis TaxID=373 RepID=UPI001573F73E|nr:hemerythrin domain-containing protein [Agrobacterium vitis]NSZ16680.1 hemerythrin domain-containing protein [Agrobacterium vitis]QZO05436.1 hemerythrin domain-containing protein [Agrobacterium vitis]UJL87582.1 hemerythrin domain-containing protein [Agrobacterium vitis]